MNGNLLLFEGISHTISVTDSPDSGKWSHYEVEAIALENPPHCRQTPLSIGEDTPLIRERSHFKFLELLTV